MQINQDSQTYTYKIKKRFNWNDKKEGYLSLYAGDVVEIVSGKVKLRGDTIMTESLFFFFNNKYKFAKAI